MSPRAPVATASSAGKSPVTGAFGLPIRTTLPETDGLSAPLLSPRGERHAVVSLANASKTLPAQSSAAGGGQPLADSSGPMSAFGLPLRTKLPENTPMRLTAALGHFDINTSFRVEVGEAISEHLEILKEMSDLNAELEASIAGATGALQGTDPTLCTQLSGLLSHQQNLKRYQALMIDEFFANFVQPYHLLLDPASSNDFSRLEQLQKARDASELLATLEILAANQEQDTVTAMTSFVSLFSTTFTSAQKSLEGFSKLLSLFPNSDRDATSADASESSSSNSKFTPASCPECNKPRTDDGDFCGECGAKIV